MTWWNRPGLCDFDAVICDGAVRSGKTVAAVCGFFLWSMTAFHGQVFALCGKTVSSLRRNVIIHLPQWLGRYFSVTEHRQDNRLTVRLFGHVNTYYLFGGQDESSYMLIQGITLAGALMDEVVLMPRSFVEQTCARCSVPGARLWFSCNPADPAHWFYKEWVSCPGKKNALYLHFTMEDNPGLARQVRRRYERMFSGMFYRRYVLGQWCRAEGLVYQIDPESLVTQQLPLTGRYYISVDYGVHNPFSAGLWCVRDGVAYRVKEFYHSGRDTGKLLTDQEYHEALEKLAAGCVVEQVIVDPSAAGFINLLRRRGVFRVRKAKNDVLPGIRQVTTLLHQGKLRLSPECKNALREFSLYCWDDRLDTDTPKKENDHAMDEIRYFAMGVMERMHNA